MKTYTILHNIHDKRSRKFVDDYGLDHTIVNWYEDGIAVAAYLSAGNPSPSSFPSVVDTQKKIVSRLPMTLDLAIQDIKDQDMVKDSSKQYKLNRQRAYEEQGLTPFAWTMALVQFQEDNDDSELVKLRNKRTAIKTAIPKDMPNS